MIKAAAEDLVRQLTTQKDKNSPLLPPISEAREVALKVADAVGKRAIAEGMAGVADDRTFERELREYVWEPAYVPYERVRK